MSPTEDVLDKEVEVESKNQIDKSKLVVPVVPSQTEQGIEVVPQVVLSVVPSVVLGEINWKTYPYNSRDTPSSTSEEVIELEFEELIEAIDVEMKRIGWSESNGQQHLMDTYGKKSRRFLTDEELLAFWDYLKEQKEDIKK